MQAARRGSALRGWALAALAIASWACGGAPRADSTPSGSSPRSSASAVLDPAPVPLSLEARDQALSAVYSLPADARRAAWREHAAHSDAVIASRALDELALTADDHAAELATTALARDDPAVRAAAARALATLGPKLAAKPAEQARSALRAALSDADATSRPAIVWALVTLRDAEIAKDALELVATGDLEAVERPGGGAAFRPHLLGELLVAGDLAKIASHSSTAVRSVAAATLAKRADPRTTDALVALSKDVERDVAAVAVAGLARIDDPRARDALIAALTAAKLDDRMAMVDAISQTAGGSGLIAALGAAPKTPEGAWFLHDQIFRRLGLLADPSAANALARWADSKATLHPHFRAEAGARLAEIGDLRAIKLLVERMRMDPLKAYEPSKFYQHGPSGHLSKTDQSRIEAARLLGDLALAHPNRLAAFAEAEAAVLAWAESKPSPHANALRFLAIVKSSKARPKIAAWASPKSSLPTPGASAAAFSNEWMVVAPSLRWLAAYGDPASLDAIARELDRKDPALDITQEGLMGGTHAVLGMVLRSIGIGAAEGLGELGDPKASARLMKLVEDRTWHEDARLAACESLAWTATDHDAKEIARRASTFSSALNATSLFIGACYARTVELRHSPELRDACSDRIAADAPEIVQLACARSLGRSGLDAASADKVLKKLDAPGTRVAAALASILGGDSSAATRAAVTFRATSPAELEALKDSYAHYIGALYTGDIERGALGRWVRNAEALARVEVGGINHGWAIQSLGFQLDNVRTDQGPRTVGRVALRLRLLADAGGADETRRTDAIRVLLLAREHGALRSLATSPGPAQDLADAALHELLNPVPRKPEDPRRNR